MLRNQDLQRLHYDARARSLRHEVLPGPPAVGAAAVWEELQAPYRFAEKRLLAAGVEGKRMLDYGCGYGAAAMFFAQHGAHVTGVDISPASLEIARERAARLSLTGSVRFEEADCEALPEADGTFDFIVSVGTLSCLDLSKAFSELARVLKREGHAVIVDTLGHNPIANTSRRLKYWLGLKTEWTLKHTLSMPDLESLQRYFDEVEVHFFDLATQSLVLLRACCGGRRIVPLRVVRAVQRLDRSLLARGALQRYAWKVVCVLSGPQVRERRS